MYKFRIRIWWEVDGTMIEELVVGKDFIKNRLKAEETFIKMSQMLHAIFGLMT